MIRQCISADGGSGGIGKYSPLQISDSPSGMGPFFILEITRVSLRVLVVAWYAML